MTENFEAVLSLYDKRMIFSVLPLYGMVALNWISHSLITAVPAIVAGVVLLVIYKHTRNKLIHDELVARIQN